MSDELTLRARVVRGGDLDREIAALPWIGFVRHDGALFIRCAASLAEEVVAALARSGIAAEGAPLRPSRLGLRAAIVPNLFPLASPAIVDTVDVRAPALGEAIDLVRALTGGLLRRRNRERRDRIRALLRCDDQLLSWRRVLWAPPAVLRAAHITGARPVVFDRDGIEHARERITFAGCADVARWASA